LTTLLGKGGGPTAVIAQSLVGAILRARLLGTTARIYGALHGVQGIVNQDFVDLTDVPEEDLELVAKNPGAQLRSTRDKPDQVYCANILRVLQAHRISSFLYIGGNDTSETLRILSTQAAAIGYDLTCVHVPKTIDNDLVCNDHTPGYPSSARFVGHAFMGINRDVMSLPGVYIGVVMGRHAGWLTAASALAKEVDDDGPHLIYMPERDFDMQTFLRDVKAVYDRLGRCIVAVSEGVHDASGKPILHSFKDLDTDPHGNVRLSGTGALADFLSEQVKHSLGIQRVIGDTLGYLQRSFPDASDVDRREARMVGERAALYASLRRTGSVTINRIGDYKVDYGLVDLADVAGKTRVVPDAFISDSGTDVNEAFLRYLRPLVGSDFRRAYSLRAPAVPKILLE